MFISLGPPPVYTIVQMGHKHLFCVFTAAFITRELDDTELRTIQFDRQHVCECSYIVF